MVNSRGTGAAAPAFQKYLFVSAVLALLSFFSVFPVTAASAASGKLSGDDQQCLGCHSTEKMEKKLGDSKSLPLHVKGDLFAKSVHIAIGCAGCHSDVSLKTHPSNPRKIGSWREYSVAMTQVCKTCHEDKFKLYESSIHAALVRSGNEGAPICTDCHSPHEVSPKAVYQTMASVPCQNCHSDVFKAYSESMHGKARAKSAGGGAPLCADCHSAHDVKVASAGEGRREACLTCHVGVVTLHKEWLPNADLHFETISCPVCHSPSAKRRVDLRLSEAVGSEGEQKGVPRIERRLKSADAKGKGVDAMEMWNLLSVFSQDGARGKTVLRGRLEVSSGAEAHQLADKTKALSDCKVCHSEGAEAFQSVTVSVAGPEGLPVRFGATKDVLNSVVSVDAVRGFYAIGGTRIKLLDILFLLSLFAGFAVPAGHMTAKWAFRIYLKKMKEEEAAAAKDKSEAKGKSGHGHHHGRGASK